MKSSIIPTANQLNTNKGSMLEQFARRRVHQLLSRLDKGEIIIREQGQEWYFGESNQTAQRIHLNVLHSSFWTDLAFGGITGAGEAYIKGSWQCNDLVELVRLILKNRPLIERFDAQFGKLKVPMRKTLHWLSRNTRKGSQRNIRAHYDLGNDLFELFLDKSMMNSSAYYPSEQATLEQAAEAKLDMICQKLQLQPGDRVIEIGTGWGGFAIHAAKNYGCHVTTTTISAEQYQYASQRIAENDLQSRITLLDKDYRQLSGEFDKLVSIEMIEAVGHQYLNTFFEVCQSLLKPGGQMLIQAITISDAHYQKALKNVDFIKKYIFPGGFLPSISAMMHAVACKTRLKLTHLEDIGLHYAATLADWRERFNANTQAVQALGYPDSFHRLWNFYLCYCEGGFREKDLGTVQMLFESRKP